MAKDTESDVCSNGSHGNVADLHCRLYWFIQMKKYNNKKYIEYQMAYRIIKILLNKKQMINCGTDDIL